MSFLKGNPASGLGQMLGQDPQRIQGLAHRIGSGMNMIAAGGGAQPGYAGTAPVEEAPANVMQTINPRMLDALMMNFRGGRF